MGEATLTADIVAERRLDLQHAIDLAETEYQTAAFDAQTGKATSADVKDARDKLDQLRADLEALEAAWAMAKARSVDDQAERNAAAYKAFLDDCEALLKTRRKAVLEVQHAAKKMVEAINAYDAATMALRTRPGGLTGRQNGAAGRSALNLALDPSFPVAAMVACSVLCDAGVNLPAPRRSSESFRQATPQQFEETLAARVRSALAMFAPEA